MKKPYIENLLIQAVEVTFSTNNKTNPVSALGWMLSVIENDLKKDEVIEGIYITEPFKIDMEITLHADIGTINIMNKKGKTYSVNIVDHTYKGCDLYIERRHQMLLKREAFTFKK